MNPFPNSNRQQRLQDAFLNVLNNAMNTAGVPFPEIRVGGPAGTAASDASPTNNTNVWRPKLDVFEAEEKYILVCDLAGVCKDDITLNIADQVLKISGNRHLTFPNTNRKRNEWILGNFERTFRLPADANTSQISAETKDGALKISIPKVRFAPDSISISITDAAAKAVEKEEKSNSSVGSQE